MKLLLKLLLVPVIGLVTHSVYSQSDFCSTATTLTPCVGQAGNNIGATWNSATDDSYAAADICAASVENTVWYTFTAPSAGTYDFTFAGMSCGSGFGAQIGALTGPCGGPYTSLNCVYVGSGTTGTMQVVLSAGQQIWLVIDGDGGDQCSWTLTGCNISCSADAGTVTVQEDGGAASSPIYLCANGTNCVDLTSNNDYTLPPPQAGETSELMYALYTCPPTTADPGTDPCYSGLLWSGQDFTDCNPSTYGLTGTYYFVPITADDSDNGGNPNGVIHYDQDGDGCFDLGTPIQITYLNPITFAATENCNGTVDVVITGGMPEVDGSNYIITNTGAGTLAPGSVTHGGTATITGLTNGQSYSLSVTDNEGCTYVYAGGTYNSALDASFNYGAAAYCVNDADPTPTITGDPGGTFTSSPAGLSINAATGQIDVSASTPGVTYTVTYTTPGPCSSSNQLVTINPLDDASFNYGSPSYCISESDPTPTITGLGGGTFTSAPAGLVINASTGTIDVSASTPNTYTVTYTTSGTCPNSSNVSVTITNLDDASFNYASATYCANDPDPTPTITGVGGGSFTSAPAGLVINGTTGAIDLSASTPNTYTITYTTGGACSNSSNVNITVNAADDPSFNYAAATYCVDAADPTPTITGTGGGTFTSAPAGLSINATTGQIDVSASTPNTYTITYTTSGACPASSNVNVTINALDDATFNYGSPSYCVNDADPTPTITGLGGGTFSSSPAGLSINAGTGQIDVSASTPNTYTITYTTAGPCPNISNVNVTISALDDASFNYAAAAYCVNDSDPTPTITGVGGGAFTSSPAGLVINGTTGVIDVSASTPNTYTVTYTTAGACANSSSVNVTINPLDDASFNYAAAAYCVSDSDPTPTITGLGGGTFTSSPAGLVINATTGVIDVSASTPNAYTITYTTSGTCPNSSNVNVTINALDDASFSYGSPSYCVSASDPSPTITGLGGGTFTSSPAGLVINASTGLIDVSASTPNSYTVTYTTAGTCPNSATFNVTITNIDDASFNYGAAAYCMNDTDPQANITGTAGGSFTSAPAGLVIDGSTGLIDVSASTPNTYTITYTTSGVCSNSSNVNVTINGVPTVTATNSGPICADATSFTLDETGGQATSWNWVSSGSATITAAGDQAPTITGAVDGEVFTVTGTDANGCSTTDQTTITINPLPVITPTNNGPICAGATVTLDETGGNATGWSWTSNGSAVITTATDQSPTATGAVDGEIFTVIGTDGNGCSNTATTTISVIPLPALDAVSDVTVCDSYALPVITGTDLTGSESYYNDSQANGGTAITGPITSTQTVWVFDGNGSCSDETSFVVTINNTEDASFLVSDFCVGDVNAATVTGTTGGSFAFAPDLNDGATIDVATGEISNPVAGTTYTISYTTAGPCPATMTAVVLAEACGILIPTAITPNNTPNDTWEIPNLDVAYPNNIVTVYNRWGNVVFQHESSASSPYDSNRWDGRFNGEELPVASYYYVIQYNDGSDEGATGTVTIIRK